jgi:hypothetical protein
MGVAARFGVAAVLFVAWAAQAAEPASLQQSLAGAEVDWSEGTITASAGAAADMRMPSPDAARPGAGRRATAAALAKLRAALKVLPMGAGAKLGNKEIEAALGKASTVKVEYQSNGGVVLRMRVSFEDLLGGKNASSTATATATATATINAVGETGLAFWPVVVLEGKEIVLRRARYQTGAPPKDAIRAKPDDKGRLVLAKGAAEDLAAAAVVIYVQKVAP